MRIALWLVPGLSGLMLLLVGMIIFFGMLVALNGFSGDAGGKMLGTYLILLVLTLSFSVWASRRGVQALVQRTNWPLWICSLVVFVATVVLAGAFLVFDSLMVIFIGSEVLGMR